MKTTDGTGNLVLCGQFGLTPENNILTRTIAKSSIRPGTCFGRQVICDFSRIEGYSPPENILGIEVVYVKQKRLLPV